MGIWDYLTGPNTVNPAEVERQRRLAAEQEAIRQQVAARDAAERLKAQAIGRGGLPQAAPLQQGGNEWDIAFKVRNALAKPFEAFNAFVEAPARIPAFSQQGVDSTRATYKNLTTTPNERKAAAAQPKPKAAAKPAAFQQQGAAQAPQQAAWAPFQGFQTGAPGQMPGAPRDGGSRLHAANAQDFSGMKVGTPVPAPPMGARLIGSGSGGNSGNWGKWQLPDGSSMRLMHLVNKPTEETVGPGQPMAFLGNTGNASTRGTDRAVAHVETWDKSGKPIAPTAFFNASGGGGQSAAGGGSAGPAVTAFRGAVDSVGGLPASPQLSTAGVDAHMQLQGKMLDNILRDQTHTYTPPDYPDRPEPKPFQDVNYEKADALFAAGAPKNPFGDTPEEQEKQQLKMRRASYWAGLGQAFMSFRDGQGIGSLLANAGGAMLAGSMAGSEKVREKLEEHDRLMSQYNLQSASREGAKASNTANLINSNITQQNQYAKELWADQRSELAKFEPVYENGRVRMLVKNNDGTVTSTSKLLDLSQTNQVLDSMGLSFERKAGIQNEQSMLDYQSKLNEFKMIIPFAFQDAISKGDMTSAGNLAQLGASAVANELVEGNQWEKVLAQVPQGDQRVAKLNYDAWNTVGGVIVNPETGQPEPGQSITNDQQQRHDAYIRSNLVQQFMETKQMFRLLGGPTEEVYTDQGPKMPRTGVRSTKAPDTDVVATILGNREAERQVTRRSSQKLPFGGSESTTIKGY